MPTELQLTDKQRRKLEKLAKLLDEGNMAILQHLFEMEEEIESKLEMISRFEKMFDNVKGKDGKDGKDGESIKGDKGERGEVGERGERGEKGKDGKDGKDGSPDTAEQVRDKLETLRGNARLDKSAIKGLDEKLTELEKGKNVNIIAGARKYNSISKYSLTSQCDGATKAFTLPIDTTDVLGVFGTQFPVQYDASGDWTFSGRTLTLGNDVSAPQTGQTLWVLIVTL